MSGDRTEETINDPAVALRMAGKRYPEIAAALGIPVGSARRRVKRAVQRGEVEALRVSYRPFANAPLASDEAYHARWLERVMARIIVDSNGCWRWQGFKGHTGYAQTGYRGQPMNGHRAMYMIHFGVKLRTEQYVLHKCDVRDCINPDHLWIGTAADNNRDCAAKGRHFEGSKTHCMRGHEFTSENTKLYPNGRGSMSRKCLTCDRDRYWRGRK